MQAKQEGEGVEGLLSEGFNVFEEDSQRLVKDGGEDIQGLSRTLGHNGKVNQ